MTKVATSKERVNYSVQTDSVLGFSLSPPAIDFRISGHIAQKEHLSLFKNKF